MSQVHEPLVETDDQTSQDEDVVEAAGRGVWRALGTGLSAGLLALIVGLALVTIIIPRASGATALTVLTGSMEPKLPPGTLLVVKPKPIEDIQIGDVVTYEPNANDATTVISHRVIGITDNPDGTRTFTVKGDANTTADAPVRQKQVVATLWYAVPWLGWANSFTGGANSAWLVPVAAGLLLVYAAWNFISGLVERKRRGPRGRRRAA
jgi:signal peptidase